MLLLLLSMRWWKGAGAPPVVHVKSTTLQLLLTLGCALGWRDLMSLGKAAMV